jgi:hypothetical protein
MLKSGSLLRGLWVRVCEYLWRATVGASVYVLAAFILVGLLVGIYIALRGAGLMESLGSGISLATAAIGVLTTLWLGASAIGRWLMFGSSKGARAFVQTRATRWRRSASISRSLSLGYADRTDPG